MAEDVPKWPKRLCGLRPMVAPTSPTYSERLVLLHSGAPSPRLTPRLTPAVADCGDCVSLRAAQRSLERRFETEVASLREELTRKTQEIEKLTEEMNVKYKTLGEALLKTARNTEKLREQIQRQSLMEGAFSQQQLSYEEVVKVTKALKQKEFGDLFKSYLDEISDPSHRQEYEQYLSDLEKKGEMPRGKKLVRAKPGVCLSTHLLFKNGQKQKLYLNLCQTAEIGNFSFSDSTNLSLPHVLSPPRVDRDEEISDHTASASASAITCLTADLAVHPQTLNACMRDRRILKILTDVAADALTQNFFRGHEAVSRDFRLEKFPCKGGAPMPMSVNSSEISDQQSPPSDAAAVASVSPADVRKMQEEAAAAAAETKAEETEQPGNDRKSDEEPEISYRLVESESVEIGSNTKFLKIFFACPKIASAKDLDLDVSEFSVSLKIPKTGAACSVPLANKFPNTRIDVTKVKATFDKNKKELVLQISALPSAPQPPASAPALPEQHDDDVDLPLDLPQSEIPPEPVPAADAEAQELPRLVPVTAHVAASVAAPVAAVAAPFESPPAEAQNFQTSFCCAAFAGQNRQNVFYRTDVEICEPEIVADKSCVLVKGKNAQWFVAFPSGHFVDKRQVHISCSAGATWLVCRKSTQGEWKQLMDETRELDEKVFAPAEVEPQLEVETSAEADTSEEFTGLETYCHAIRLNYPWLYALF